MEEQSQWLGELQLFLEEENLQLKNKTICMFVKQEFRVPRRGHAGLKNNSRLPVPEAEKRRL